MYWSLQTRTENWTFPLSLVEVVFVSADRLRDSPRVDGVVSFNGQIGHAYFFMSLDVAMFQGLVMARRQRLAAISSNITAH